VLTATRAAIDACVQAAARYGLSDNATDRDLAAAAIRCHRAAGRRDRLRVLMRTAAARTCARAASTMRLLLDPHQGPGFRDVAAGCPFDAARAPTTEDLLDCLAARAACLGERAVAQSIPRAYDFLSDVVDDPDAEFPCIVDPYELTPDPSSPGAAFLEPAGR
jgi:hypothetical protein